MNEIATQIRIEFVEDLRSLCKDYGWTIDQAMEIIGFELKQNKN